jgi:5'-nucleotidase
MPQTILVTNDDGIDSYFLHALVAALQKAGYVTKVAAPLGEQSWISRAVSRRREVRLAEYPGLGDAAWSLDGTPTDCVNIALGHLLPERPAAVVSGINICTNIGLPHIMSSGTVAGALEGAFWNLPALAFSFEMPPDRIQETRRTQGRMQGALAESLQCAAGRAADFVRECLAHPSSGIGPTVHNINFPSITTSVTPVVRTRPGRVRLGKLFTRESPASFRFHHQPEPDNDRAPEADHAAIARGNISHSILDYGTLGR